MEDSIKCGHGLVVRMGLDREGKMGFGQNCAVKLNKEWEMREIVWNQQVFSAISILS